MKTLNLPGDGYHGIWYMNQPVPGPIRYKYSGGLGTYCEEHSPFAVYAPAVHRTFFCYGGAPVDYWKRPELLGSNLDTPPARDALLHMVGCYDHATGRVSRPTILLDKETMDAHDNPVLAIDDAGLLWIFSTAHGTQRPSLIHRSLRPYDVSQFEPVPSVRRDGSGTVPFDNFSYMQVRHVPGMGFAAFLTRYRAPAIRTPGLMTSPDGITWSDWRPLAAIEQGHYAIGEVAAGRTRAGMAFNYHPDPGGLNYRTNLYYMETADWGTTWRTADGRALAPPLREPHNPALVHDYEEEGLKVYMKDLTFDAFGRPVILFITSRGYEPGPENGPRVWHTARWTGADWEIRPVTESDSCYDTGPLFIEPDGTWRLIGPTEPGPQPYNPGGEMAMWLSRDRGASWSRARQMTAGSRFNHTYARRPVAAHPDFMALWADGHGREPSPSSLYFSNRAGDVRKLPEIMTETWQTPAPLPPVPGS